MSNVVVGYVPTELGEHTLTEAIQQARWRSATLVVVNFSRDDVLADPAKLNTDQEVRLREQLDHAGVAHELLLPREGNDPAVELLDTADHYQAELMVIGLRQRTAVGKMLMGSTAQRILLGSPCPVLGVRFAH